MTAVLPPLSGRRVRPVPAPRRPSVSVVVPCYNYGHFLPDAVRSALDQPGVDVEVLVVDDASPDGSVRVAHELAARDERVRVLAHEENRGHIATYNDGLALARGDYVVLLSADDLLAPGSLQRATALMEAHPDVTFTYGYAESFTDRPPAARTAVRSWTVWPGEEWLGQVSRSARNVVVNPEVVMRGSVMAELRGYDPGLPHAADLELWLRAARLGSVGRVDGPHQAFYRAHGGNMHLTDYKSLLQDLEERRTSFDAVLATADHRRSARRALAREAVRLAWQAERLGGTTGGASGADLRTFATETWPQITRSPAWAVLHARADRPAGHAEVAVAALYLRARYHLWWRRWRRWGL